jgi:AraC-like DNA-binding protein
MQMHPDPALSLRRYGAAPGSHTHAHHQLLWGWQGTLALEMEGRGARVGPGRVAVIAPGMRHDFESESARGARCFVLDLQGDGLDRWAGAVHDLGSGWMQLLGFLSTQAPGSAAWTAAVPLLLQSLPAAASGCAGTVTGRSRRIDWDLLQAWVDARLHEPLDVATLAAQVHLSPSQFAERCVARCGLPPLAWVRERRLHAARRLRAQGLAVAETARRCGYRSPSALTAALRRSG